MASRYIGQSGSGSHAAKLRFKSPDDLKNDEPRDPPYDQEPDGPKG